MKAIEFKKEAERAIDKIKSAVWTSTCFFACQKYIDLLINTENIDPFVESSLMRSIIIEYNKIFNSESRPGLSNKYLTKDNRFIQKQHKFLTEMRNLGIAHSHPNFEAQVGYLFFSAVNNLDQVTNPVKSVELPFRLHIQTRNFSTLKIDIIKSIATHIKICNTICEEYIKIESANFFQFCLKNYKNLSKINNSFAIDWDNIETYPPEINVNLMNEAIPIDLSADKIEWISKTFIHTTHDNKDNLNHEDEFIKIEYKKQISGYEILFKTINPSQ